MAVPRLGGANRPGFVASWWAILLALSSFARYEPALWTRAIDVDRSQLAVPIEQICDYAATFVPGVLCTWLTDANAPRNFGTDEDSPRT